MKETPVLANRMTLTKATDKATTVHDYLRGRLWPERGCGPGYTRTLLSKAVERGILHGRDFVMQRRVAEAIA